MPFFGGLNNYRIYGSNNFAGIAAADNLTSGAENVILGNEAAGDANSAARNAVIGFLAGAGLTFGHNNVMVGQAAGVGDPGELPLVNNNYAVLLGSETYAEGDRSIAIGYRATSSPSAIAIGANAHALVDSIAIGSLAQVSADGVIQIGTRYISSNANTKLVIGNDSGFADRAEIIIGHNVSDQDCEINSTLVGAFVYQPTFGMLIPIGTTAQRDPAPVDGEIRKNSTLNQMEIYEQSSGTWKTVASVVQGAGGAALGTLTNAPTAGNPATWLQVRVNGTLYKIPAWI